MNALKMLLTSKSPELLGRMSPDLFGVLDLQKIFRLITNFYGEHGEFMGWSTLISEIERRSTDLQKASFLTGLVQDIRDRDTSGLSFEETLKALNEYRRFRVILTRTDSLIGAVEGKNAEAAVATLQQMYEDVFTSASAGHDLDSCDMVNMAGKQVKFNFRKTGIDGIDRRGGLIEGGYTILGAVAKAGKSTMAIQCGLHSYDTSPGSVAVFTYEQQAGEIRSRILSNRADLDLGLIMSGLMTPEQRLLLRVAEAQHLTDFTETMRDYCHQRAAQADDDFWPGFWNQFAARENRFLLIDRGPNWDELFTQMDILHKSRGVKMFIVDYPFLVPRGNSDSHMASWEYNLKQSQKLKQFASRNKCWVIAPAQFDDKNDTLKFVKNAVNDCDLFIALTQEDGDTDIGEAGAVTATFKAYRNFLSIPGEPILQPFKMLREFQYSRFRYFAY
jgi:replicative DNA helicase